MKRRDESRGEVGIDRRSFVRTVGQGVVAAAVAGKAGAHLQAAPTPNSPAETLVKEFYDSLSPTQRNAVCLPFDDPRRLRISPNWHVTEPNVGDDFYRPAQRELIARILKSVMSEDGYARVQKQMEDDAGGLDFYSVAIFGRPGVGKFQWELTGRHLAIRADGNSVDKMAFGGPIVYGHGEETPRDNLFYYQTKLANAVFDALDPDQRMAALLKRAPRETDVPLQGKKGTFPGIRVSEMSDDQKALFKKTVRAMLAPYRKEDVDEVVDVIKKTGGFESLSMAFYQQGDLEKDRIWDIWRVEGPGFVWHFRGAPHVHTYIHVGLPE